MNYTFSFENNQNIKSIYVQDSIIYTTSMFTSCFLLVRLTPPSTRTHPKEKPTLGQTL